MWWSKWDLIKVTFKQRSEDWEEVNQMEVGRRTFFMREQPAQTPR